MFVRPPVTPQLVLSESGGIIASSDDWIDDATASTIASYHLDPSDSQESAILATLNPGSYTVVVKPYDDPSLSTDNVPGIGLIELYDLHTTGGRAGNTDPRCSSTDPMNGFGFPARAARTHARPGDPSGPAGT